MRLIARIFLFASSLFIILYGILPGFFRLEGGFIPFYVAGRNLLDGINPILLYRFPDFQKLIDVSGLSTSIFSVTGSTPASFLIAALIAIPPAGLSKFILTAMNLGAFFLLVHVSAKLANSSTKTAYLVFLSSSFALATNFSSGEHFIITSLFFCTAFFSFSVNAERATGAILAAIFPFELFTAIPAILFLLAKRWRVFIYFLLMSLFLLLITYVLAGEPVITFYLQRVFPFYLNGRVQNPFSISYQTAWSFLRTIFLFNPTLNPHPILASRNAYVFSISLFKAFVAVPSAYFFYRGVEKKDARESIIASTFPIIFLSPTATIFQLLLLAPAILCLARLALDEQRIRTARTFMTLYALGCLPIYSLFSSSLNIRTPFLLYERFFLLLSIYMVYLFFQLRLLPKHLLVVRMSITTAIIAAVTVTLYMGDRTPEPARILEASPVLNGNQLRNAAFSPAVHGEQLSYISMDSTSQNYVVSNDYLSGSNLRTSIHSFGQNLPGNCYRVSTDENGKNSAIETTTGQEGVVSFHTQLGQETYRGRAGSVSGDGDFGAFISEASLFIVDLRSEHAPIVDSLSVLPFKVTQCSFSSRENAAEEIVLLIDSLNGANSIGTYNLAAHSLETRRTLFPVSMISADGDKFYLTSEDDDSTSVWSQSRDHDLRQDTGQPYKLFTVHGNIMDIEVVRSVGDGPTPGGRSLYFSSDFERGLDLPMIYRYRLDNREHH